ncbi:MAG: hypothetical protein KBT22_07440 [Bacteroidales bacterium]|nr:hypothetical protein [Candidatus Scybalocola fimicaballi]
MEYKYTYKLKRLNCLFWELRQEEDGVVLEFGEGYLNSAQFWNVEDDHEIVQDKLDSIKNEMVHFIHEKYSCLVESNYEFRLRIVNILNDEFLQEVADKLKGKFSHEQALDFARNLEIIHPSAFLYEFLETCSIEDLEDLIRMVNAYWLEPYEVKEWRKDLWEWLTE